MPVPLPRWRRWLVPLITSERHAIRALVVGFLLEAITEIYQLVTTIGSVRTTPIGYYASLGLTLVGFYFLWRGLHEWNRLHPRPVRVGERRTPWGAISMLVGGIVAVSLLDIGRGTVGGGDTPPLLAWVVGGVMVLAFGSFFLTLRRMVAPMQSPTGRALGWAAFAWSLGVSTVAGLAIGHVIVGLFVDFFTNWTTLILALAPFVFAIAPLFVTYLLLSIGYADALRNGPGGERPSRIAPEGAMTTNDRTNPSP